MVTRRKFLRDAVLAVAGLGLSRVAPSESLSPLQLDNVGAQWNMSADPSTVRYLISTRFHESLWPYVSRCG